MRSGLQKIRPGRNGEDQLQGVLRNDEPEEVIYGRIGEKTMHANPDNKLISVFMEIGRFSYLSLI